MVSGIARVPVAFFRDAGLFDQNRLGAMQQQQQLIYSPCGSGSRTARGPDLEGMVVIDLLLSLLTSRYSSRSTHQVAVGLLGLLTK